MTFLKLEEALTTAPILDPPVWGEPFELLCDASDYTVGVVLGQQINKKPHVIYYASHTLNEAYVNYTINEKEFLVVAFRLEKFRLYLIGSHVIVFIDHVALKHLFYQKDEKLRLI